MADFEIPSFLQNRSANENFKKIKSILPSDIDVSEGSHGWNLTYPIALVAAEICERILPEVVRLIIPDWSYGEFADGHAKSRGIYRRPAICASGEITITGKANTTIPAGSLFSVPAVNNEPSIDYATTTEVTIPASGTVTVPVQCTQAGTIGNTTSNTIIIVSSKLTDITSVTNEDETAGGLEEESDEELKERMAEYDKTQGYSFVGNDADYERWAKEAGAGSATVVPPEDDSGMVTLIVTDIYGNAADEVLRDKVYNYIISPDDRNKRLAPIGATLNVTAPKEVVLHVSATVELTEGASLNNAKEKFAAQLKLYLAEAMSDKEIRYSRVCSILSSTEGIYDYIDVELSYDVGFDTFNCMENIEIQENELYVIDESSITLTVGTVSWD